MPVLCRQHDEKPATRRGRPSTGVAPALRIVARPELHADQYASDVAKAVALVARTCRLSPAEAEDLESDVWVRLLERDTRVLRSFTGRARIGTYLVTIARNLLFDRRNKEWGRWRPSTVARRTGQLGVALDRMLTRDGWSLEAAEQSLKCAGVMAKDASVRSLAALLPVRHKRTFVNVDALKSLASSLQDHQGTSCGLERASVASDLQTSLTAALSTLSAFDRQLLSWRFGDGMTVAAIAPLARLDARALYRHFDKLLRQLRSQLEAAGVDTNMVRFVTSDTLRRVDCDLLTGPSPSALLRRKLA